MDISNNNTVAKLLAILSTGRKTGYEIAADLLRLGEYTFRDNEVCLYPLLHRLERQKIIRGILVDLTGGAVRKYYQLTFRGKAQLRQSLRIAPPAGSTPISPAPEPPYDHNMSMRIMRIRRWSNDAVIRIRVSPDREIVAREIYDHMYDRFCRMISEGATPDDAEALTIRAMGSAADAVAELGDLHRPFWTRALRATRCAIAGLCILTVFTYGLYLLNSRYFSRGFDNFDSDAGPVINGEHRLLQELESDAYTSSDGYLISADRAYLWHSSDDSSNTRQLLNIQLKVVNPIPWAEKPDFAGWIWAEDSLGNYYYSSYEDSLDLEPSIQATTYRTSSFTSVIDLWIYSYVSQDAQWIDLHYDRSGRDITLRIHLTGGETS